MTRLALLAAVFMVIMALQVQGAERWISFKVVTPEEVDLTGISKIGRDVLSDTDDWLIGRSENFIVFGHKRPLISRAVDEAENALRQAREWLGLTSNTTEPSLLVFIDLEDQWKMLVRGHGIRNDGLAMQIENEMYFKDDPEQNKRPDRVAHEVFHFLLARTFPSGMPLWLEEGLAIHYGWASAVKMNDQRELIISRQQPALDEKLLVSPEKLLTMKHYPVTEEHGRAFFRQSEELVALLVEKLGDENMAQFVRCMSSGNGDALENFRRCAGFADGDERVIFDEARQHCLMSSSR